MEDKLSTMQKALAINLDDNIYGTIAEIGAGQEVHVFFQAEELPELLQKLCLLTT